MSLPKALVALATVRTLVEGDPSTAADYVPDSHLSITTMRASLSTTRTNLLAFLEAPDQQGHRRMMQLGVDGVEAFGRVVSGIHPQVMLVPGYFGA